MIYIVYFPVGVVAFVSHEMEKMFEYIGRNKYYKVELWNGARHTGGFFR